MQNPHTMKQNMTDQNKHLISICIGLVFSLGCASVAHSQIQEDQDVPAGLKAAIAINIDVAELMANSSLKPLTAMISDEDIPGPFSASEVSKVSALIAAPKGMEPEAFESMNFYVYIGFEDPATTERVKNGVIAKGGVKVDVNNKSCVQPSPVEGFPPGTLMEFYPNGMVIASTAYMTSNSNQFASKGLASAYGKLSRQPIRIAIDMDCEREMLDQLHEMANATADFMTKPYVSLIKEVSSLAISSDPTAEVMLRINVNGHDEKEGASIKLKLDALVGLGKGVIDAASQEGFPGVVTTLIEGIRTGVEGSQAYVELKKPAGFEKEFAKMMEQTVVTAKQTSDMNTFKQAMIGLHNYHDANRGFPFKKHAQSEDAKSGLSWMVYILPYVEETRLFNQFDLEQSFNQPKNAPLAQQEMVLSKPLNTGGRISWVRASNVPQAFRDITDGTSRTICLIQNRKESMSPWTQPTSVAPAEVLRQLRALKEGEVMLASLYDGSVQRFTSADVERVESMLEPSDGK